MFNNSSESFIEFEVISQDNMVIEGVRNYPNPVTDYTYFVFNHNKADSELEITLDIFDLSGRNVVTLKQFDTSTRLPSILSIGMEPMEMVCFYEKGSIFIASLLKIMPVKLLQDPTNWLFSNDI